ncbi:lysosomal acid lipase/cholesteryl ester hydrolase-like [Mantella aurantiaca]
MWVFTAVIILIAGSITETLYIPSEENEMHRKLDPELNMNVSELIRYRGYPSEEYSVVTEDGYILTINRIPHGIKLKCAGSRPVVFLQHGLLEDASIFITNFEYNSLGFILADACYDVWMGNSRGNIWSRKHKSLSSKDSKYWAFSFDDMAKKDHPAVIDFILKTTGQVQLSYIGHSQGATTAFVAFSTMPQLAKKIKINLALGPVAIIRNAKGLYEVLKSIPESLFESIFGNKEFLPSKSISLQAEKFCNKAVLDEICGNIVFLLCGFNKWNTNMSRIPVYFSHNPAGASVQNLRHWVQTSKSGKLQAYDWGPEGNKKHYNQTTLPVYKIKDMKVPTAVWSGGNDWLASPKDIALLLPEIRNLVYHKEIPEWQHLDFNWGLDAPYRLFNEILQLLNQFS